LQNLQITNTKGFNWKVEVFKKSPIFASLGEDDLKELATLATFVYFKKDESIFNEGDRPNFFYILQRGRVKLFKLSSAGKIFIAFIIVPFETLNSTALFEGKAYFLSAKAMEDTTLLRIEREKYLSFLNKYPLIGMKMIAILGNALNSTYERVLDLIEVKVDQRVYNVLLMLSYKFGTTLFFKSEEIADMAGTTTETTIRVLSKLRSLGIIRSSRGKVIILDETKLGHLSHLSYII
jgi:CRP/FNR family transcriptional regulator